MLIRISNECGADKKAGRISAWGLVRHRGRFFVIGLLTAALIRLPVINRRPMK